MVTIEFTKKTLWESKTYEVGDTLEVQKNDAFYLIECQRAKVFRDTLRSIIEEEDKMMLPRRKKGYQIK